MQHPLILSQFLWDFSNKLTSKIVIHFLSCDLCERKQNLRNIYLTLYHHFELPRREPKAIFGSVIGWYLFFNYLLGHIYFLALVPSQVPRTWNLKNLIKTDLSLSPRSVIFGFLTPKNLIHTKFQDERMTRTIVITENVNSKWQILPWNTNFSQIFKSQ